MKILIIDDDSSVTAALGLLAKQNGRVAVTAASPAEALSLVNDPLIGLVIQDMNYSRSTSGEEGLELLRQIRERRPELPVILMTAWGSIALAVEGIKNGASDFVTKPWNNQQLLQTIDVVLGVQKARSEEPDSGTALNRDEMDERCDFRGFVGRDPRLLRLLDLISRVAKTDASVLITGESGTGKELVAEALHRNSRRRSAAFVKVNLGGISSTLFESEMFGHVRGAFTDARETRKGRFETADGGTIFLDEIGEIDPSSQVKLLRVLQDRTFEVLGSSRSRTVDVRVVSATNKALPDLVQRGLFREDLLYRLNLITMQVPPLRERRGDIPLLAEHFTKQFARSYGRENLSLSDKALEWLGGQGWPGNIRQLKQHLERAVLVRDGARLEVDDLRAVADVEAMESRSGALPAVGSMTLDQMERAMIEKCVQHYEGNVSRVAEALGLTRQALYRRFEKYGLDVRE